MFLSTYYIVVHSYKIKLMLKQQIMITYYSHISFEAYSDPGLTLLYSPGPGMVTLDFKTNPMLTEFSSIMTQNA